jgi:hypothetical protein
MGCPDRTDGQLSAFRTARQFSRQGGTIALHLEHRVLEARRGCLHRHNGASQTEPGPHMEGGANARRVTAHAESRRLAAPPLGRADLARGCHHCEICGPGRLIPDESMGHQRTNCPPVCSRQLRAAQPAAMGAPMALCHHCVLRASLILATNGRCEHRPGDEDACWQWRRYPRVPSQGSISKPLARDDSSPFVAPSLLPRRGDYHPNASVTCAGLAALRGEP